ncbi:conserved hypothetical protein [Treponema phagedenis]|uniref:Uncharacterized protein n=1 Tax=Treponema phagedenis TaxID=162 RepID=A0A0B7GVT0_TREPH|nr:hypothetical protein HMPREF9554_00718 [Treponema phagedenis F0421]CEM62794.1 conserved hypothetical protein [Treponema phagedenis]
MVNYSPLRRVGLVFNEKLNVRPLFTHISLVYIFLKTWYTWCDETV